MKTIRFLLLLLATQHGMACAQAPAWPAEAPEEWLLAFVDVETTGLVPGYHEMIDVGIVMTDLQGVEKDSFFARVQPEFPERTQEGARAVNAFDEEKWRQLAALDKNQLIDSIAEFHRRTAGDKSVLMVAFNSHFDVAFLDHLFRSGDRNWRELYHYFVLDLPSMAWSMGHRGLTGQSLAAALGIADEPHTAELHTGITGAQLNARIYRALLAQAGE